MKYKQKGGNIKNIYIIRHGETAWNSEKRHQGGEADIPLNDIGREQARKTGLYLKNYRMKKHNFDCIWSSSLSRAKETAEIIYNELDLDIDNIVIYDELRECGSGKLSGLKKTDGLFMQFREEKKALEPIDFIGKNEQFVNIIESINIKLNLNMESYNSVASRAKYMIEEIKKTHCKNIIIVSHSGFISTLIPQMYNIPENIISGGNCAISYHVYDEDKFHMISTPDNSHINFM